MKDIDSENNELPALAAKDTCCILPTKDIENLMPTGRVKEEYFID